MYYDVTVLISTYNREHFIIQSLNSVLNQTYKKWKILIVDDASEDNTLSVIETNLPKNTPITIIRNPENLGKYHSLNIRLNHIDTPYLIQLDSDDLFLPHTLEVLVNEAKKQPKNGVVLCSDYQKVFLDEQGKVIKRVLKKGRSFSDKYEFLAAKQTLRPRFYRTSSLKKINGWPTDDPFNGRYAEDIRVLLRLIENYRFHWINQVLYIYQKHASNLTKQSKVYNKALDWILFDTLKRWGNKYTPVFKSIDRGCK